jgi:hypothetical protein
VTGREGKGVGAGRRFPSIIFSLFSNVINRNCGCCSLVPNSSLIAASVFGNAKGGDGKIASDSNLSTK